MLLPLPHILQRMRKLAAASLSKASELDRYS